MRLIGYVRVSTEDQARDGISLDAQRERLAGYAAAHGHTLAGIEADEGISGEKPASKRPGLTNALRMLRSKQVDGLLVMKLDRLGRNALETFSLADEAERKGWQILSVYEHTGGKRRSASEKMMVGMHSLIAQFELDRIKENTWEAMHKLGRERKVRSRIAPFGWVYRDGLRVPDAGEQAIIRQLLDLRGDGYGKRRLPRMLPPNPRTGRPFTADQIASLLARIERWERDGLAVLAA